MASQIFSVNYHSRRPNMDITLSYDASRVNGEQSSTMRYTFYADLYCKPGEIYASSNATGITVTVDGVSQTFYCVGQGTASTTGPWTTSNSVTFDTTNTSTSGSTGIQVYVWCHQGSYGAAEGTDLNCTATGGPYSYRWSGNISVPVYNPYTAPSVSYNSVTGIGIINESTWTANYSVTPPTGANITDTGLDGMSGGSTIHNFSFGAVSGNRSDSFTLRSSDGFSDGSSYDTRIYVNDSHGSSVHNPASQNRTTRTYRTPKIQSVTPSSSTISGIGLGGPTINWSTNKRKWEERVESDFTTQIKFVSGNNTFFNTSDQQTGSDNNNTMFDGSEELTTTLINNKFSSAQRSVSSLTTQVVVRRTNPSSGKYAEGTTNLKIQFQPTYTPYGLQFRKNSESGAIIPAGSTIYVDEVPNIYVSWGYSDEVDSGVVNGYEVTTYNASGTKLDTYTYNVPASDVSSAKSRLGNVTISSYDLKRGEVNQIKIRAFYNKPDGTGKLYSPYLSSSFVKPVGRLSTPVITYPKSGTWHSDDFRVLFQLPSDSDYDTYSTSVKNSYTYKDIQVKINNQTYSYSTDPQIFSTDKSGYQKKICVRWMLASGVNLSTTYSIQVRVQKNYYTSDWSNWSSTVTLKVQELDFSVNKGDKILDDHFNTVGTAIRRGYTCYPFGSYTDLRIFQVEPGDYILHDDENTMYQIIKGIQNGINTWAVYDNNNCKLTNTVNAFDNDPTQVGEYITAKAEDTTVPGRNYIQILADEFNKLKN